MSDGSWQLFDADSSGLPDNLVISLADDGSGGVWVGTWEGGLARLWADGSWQVWNTGYSNLATNQVESLFSDGAGGVWVGMIYYGLARLHASGTWEMLDTDTDELTGYSVLTLLGDASGGLWVGTLEMGLIRLSADGSWQISGTVGSGLPDNGILSLAPEGSSGLWVGTKSGLGYFSADGTWQVFDMNNSGIPNTWVSALCLSTSGGLWVGTWGGLAHLAFGNKQEAAKEMEEDSQIEELYTGERAAILVHPRGTGTNETEVWFMAAYAYRVLQARGFDNDEVYFLSYMPMVDINGDGFVDRNVVDGPVTAVDVAGGTSPRDLTKSDIQTAFDWAENKGSLDQPLIFIFMDHGLTDELRLNPYDGVLSGTDHDAMLDDYQTATGNPVIVLLEACHSGSLVDDLSAQNRVVITSTGDDLAFYNNNGMLSFSRLFLSELKRGVDFDGAFDRVSADLPTYGEPFNRQIPQLDDTGDGAANTEADGLLAQTFCLNGCWGSLSGDMTLEPQTQSGTVSQGQTVTLSVQVGITEGGVQTVWAVVLTPEVAKQRTESGFSQTPAPVVSLTQGESGVWSGSFSGFHYRGDYVVTFMAKDNERFVETSTPVTLTLADGPEPPGGSAIASGDPPVVSQSLYSTGDVLLVTLSGIPSDKDLYVAVTFPNGAFLFLTDLNTPAMFDGQTWPPWTGGTTAVDLTVTSGFPGGSYTVYLLQVPAGTNPAGNPGVWELGMAGFQVQ